MKERLEYGNRTLDDLTFLDEVTKQTLRNFVARLKEAEGDNLAQVALFGSMARGDCDEDSDTDVFVLLKEGIPREKRHQISDIAFDATGEISGWRVELSPLVESVKELDEEYKGVPWRRLEPVLQEIQKDGVLLYDAAGYQQNSADTALS